MLVANAHEIVFGSSCVSAYSSWGMGVLLGVSFICDSRSNFLNLSVQKAPTYCNQLTPAKYRPRTFRCNLLHVYCIIEANLFFKKQMLSYTSVSAKILLAVVFPRQILQLRAPEKSPICQKNSFEDSTAQCPWTLKIWLLGQRASENNGWQ